MYVVRTIEYFAHLFRESVEVVAANGHVYWTGRNLRNACFDVNLHNDLNRVILCNCREWRERGSEVKAFPLFLVHNCQGVVVGLS